MIAETALVAILLALLIGMIVGGALVYVLLRPQIALENDRYSLTPSGEALPAAPPFDSAEAGAAERRAEELYQSRLHAPAPPALDPADTIL